MCTKLTRRMEISFKLPLILLLRYCGSIRSGAVISPAGAAPVCRGGDLELTCNTSGRFLQWSFSLIPANETAPMTYMRTLQNSGPNDQQTFRYVIDSTTFLYSRISAENSLPVISTLSINPINEALNGTIMNCTDVLTQHTTSTIISLLRLNDELNITQDPQKISVTAKLLQFESSDVIVVLQWTEYSPHHLYHVTVTPHLEMNFTGRTSVKLKVSYEIPYNVAIVGIPLCGQNVTTSIKLYFNQTGCQNASNNTVVGVDDITFNCLPEVLPTTNTSICRGNTEEKCTGTNEVVTRINSENIGTILGGVFAVIILLGCTTCTMIVIVKVVIKIKRKGSVTLDNLRSIELNEVQLCTTYEDQNIGKKQNAANSLVYADIGASFIQYPHQQSCASFLDLDDKPVEYAQLNHKLLSGEELSRSQDVLQPVEFNQLEGGGVDLDNLLIQLRSQVSFKWYEFGNAIGIDSKVLDMFARQCASEDCIVEMLDYWLRHSVEKPTWNDVAKALKMINLPQLALHIERVYKTGKFPVEFAQDMSWAPQLHESCSTRSMADDELPPPIPPKKLDWNENATPQL